MIKKVELQPGLTVEETYDQRGSPAGLILRQEDGFAGEVVKLSPDGVVNLARYLEHLVAWKKRGKPRGVGGRPRNHKEVEGLPRLITLTVGQAAKHIGVQKYMLYRAIEEGKLRGWKPYDKADIRINLTELERWVRESGG